MQGLEALLGSSLAPTAVFIDPKDKQTADTDLAIQVFCKRLATE